MIGFKFLIETEKWAKLFLAHYDHIYHYYKLTRSSNVPSFHYCLLAKMEGNTRQITAQKSFIRSSEPMLIYKSDRHTLQYQMFLYIEESQDQNKRDLGYGKILSPEIPFLEGFESPPFFFFPRAGVCVWHRNRISFKRTNIAFA